MSDKTHSLAIHSLHDGRASCPCGFYFVTTGPATEAEIIKLHEEMNV